MFEIRFTFVFNLYFVDFIPRRCETTRSCRK